MEQEMMPAEEKILDAEHRKFVISSGYHKIFPYGRDYAIRCFKRHRLEVADDLDITLGKASKLIEKELYVWKYL